MITKLQSIDPEGLDTDKKTRRKTWMFLGGKNRIEFMGGLGASEGTDMGESGGRGDGLEG